jgi:diguanylate cyclase (GGDEF)-like protein
MVARINDLHAYEPILEDIGTYLFKWNRVEGVTTVPHLDEQVAEQLFQTFQHLGDLQEKTVILHCLDRWFRLNFNQEKEDFIGTIQDITSFKNELLQYQNLAYNDTLTGYNNRLGITKILEEKMNQTTNSALIFIDLDNFKTLNDIYGHQAGDDMLKAVCHAIDDILPANAHLARASGDEFIIFIESFNNKEELEKLGSQVLDAIIHSNDQSKIDDATLSASIGIAVYPDDASDYEDLIQKADTAMYVAKKQGKAKFLFYTPEVEEIYIQDLKVHETLVDALKQDKFEMSYQPIYDMKNKCIEAFECCPYWKHPSLGLLDYEQFLQMLYEEGLIFAFDEWMVEHAIQTIAECKKQGIKIKLALNISPKHLAMEHFHKIVRDCLDKYQVTGDALLIEMIEFILKEDLDMINHNFKHLKEYGCRVTIDGFGINKSTISMLKLLNFDLIKINKYFIETINQEKSSEIIFNTILDLANTHQKLFIADGVLDEHQYQLLKESNCRYAQGTYLSVPKSLDKVIEMIKRTTVI